MNKLVVFSFFLVLSSSALVAQPSQYSFVFLHKKSDADQISKEKLDKLMEGHMANINRLASEGKLIAAGPFEGGGGIFVLNTTSVPEARQWLSTDPGIQANRWNVEILPYTPRLGGVCAVKEPYEMTNYTFIRFDAIVNKETAPTYPHIIKRHDDYIKQIVASGNLVTEGIFGENEGGILVIKGDLQPEVIESDPGVQEGLLHFQIKKLFIAKGAFCER